MKRALKILGLVFGGAALLVSLLYFGIRKWTANPYDRAIADLPKVEAEAKSLGLPLTPAELFSQLPISPEEDATAAYERARSKLVAYNKIHLASYWEWTRLLESTQPSDRQHVLDELKQTDAIFEAFAKASKKPKIRFTLFIAKKPSFLNVATRAGELTDDIRFFNARAETMAKLGRLDDFFRTIETAYRIISAFRYEPGWNNYLEATVGFTLVDHTVRDSLSALSSNPEGIAALKQVVLVSRSPLEPEWALKSEIVARIFRSGQILDFAKSMTTEDEPLTVDSLASALGLDGSPPSNVSAEGMMQAFECREIEAYVHGLRRYQKSRQISDFAAGYRQSILDGVARKDPTYREANQLVDTYDDSKVLIQSSQARRALLLCLIDVVFYKAKTGRFPANLAEAGANQIDPYSGTPFLYKLKKDGVLIYSVGENLIDDGGNPKDNTDLVTTYPPTIPRAH